jgi:acyl dehydratase
MATAADFVGRALGTSDWVTVGQDRIGEFADCTGDHQWIHVDVERARRESPFGAPVAHGHLTLSMVGALVMAIGIVPPDAAGGLNYGLDKVRFLAPVKAGARVRLRASLMSAMPQNGGLLLKLECKLEIENEAKPALIAEVLCSLPMLFISRKAKTAMGFPAWTMQRCPAANTTQYSSNPVSAAEFVKFPMR